MKKELNQRQQKFADFMAATGNQTESAVLAGYSPERAHVTGSELVRNRKVYEAIIRSRGRIEEELGIDPLWCARKYVDLSKSAEQAGNYTAARGCLDSLAKLMEWFPKDEKKSGGSEFGIELMLKRIEEEQKEK
jgi:hypothetical protein